MGRQKKRAGTAPKARNKANLAAEHAWEKVNPAVDSARQRIGPAAHEAREKVGPAVEHARTVIAEDVVPKVATAMSTAVTASKPYRAEAKRRGSNAFAALRGEPPASKHKRRWPRVLLVVTALGGAAVAAYRYLKGGSDRQWQPMPSTTPPSRSDVTGGAHQPMSRGGGAAGTSGRPGGEHGSGSDGPGGAHKPADQGGAAPDEAVADAPDTPHRPTTPDAPAEHTETPNVGSTDDGTSRSRSGGSAGKRAARPGSSTGSSNSSGSPRNTGSRRPRSS